MTEQQKEEEESCILGVRMYSSAEQTKYIHAVKKNFHRDIGCIFPKSPEMR